MAHFQLYMHQVVYFECTLCISLIRSFVQTVYCILVSRMVGSNDHCLSQNFVVILHISCLTSELARGDWEITMTWLSMRPRASLYSEYEEQ